MTARQRQGRQPARRSNAGRIPWAIYGIMLVTTLFWALGHPLGRIVLRTVHPLQLGFVNLLVGLLALVAYLAASGKLRELRSIPGRDVAGSLGLGVLGFAVYQVMTFSALARIPASFNAVLVATNVVMIAPLAALILGERMRWLRVAAIVCAFAGVVLVTLSQGSTGSERIDIVGCLYSLLAALSFALYTVLGKRIVQRRDPLMVTALALFSGTVLLGVATAVTVGFGSLWPAGGQAWFLMVLLGVTMIGFAYPAWFACLKSLPASRVSVFIYLTPVFAVILSFLILDERVSWLYFVGGALVLGGVVAASRAR